MSESIIHLTNDFSFSFATIPNVSWEDIGALQDIRKELSMFITGRKLLP